MNRQDVIDHLQIIRTWAAVGKDPIYRGIEPKCCEDVERWIDEALELLKEQKPKLVKVDGDYVLCPSCGNELYTYPQQKFCDECGQAVKWE